MKIDDNFYMTNRQKLLFMVEELHKRGFEKLRIIPSLAPSGMHWRCSFIDETKNNKFIGSNWLSNHEKTSDKEIELSIKENFKFIEYCKGENKEYSKWYSRMLKQLKKTNCHTLLLTGKFQKGFG